MRTFFESIEGKIRNELASAIDYRMLSVCFIHLFRNRKIVHKENLIGNLSLPVSLSLFDVEKPRPTPFLAGRSDPLRVLRNTESSLRCRVHYFSLRKHLFGKYLLLSRSPSCAGLVFKKMESLFCSDEPDFYPSFPSSKGFRLRIKSVLLRLISFVSHFSYDKGRKQSTQSRHCSTEKIYRSWEFCPDEKQTKEDKTCAYQQPFYQCCFHLDFLRGLNRYLSLQPKFYSYPRRPLFLGALGKVKALLAPRACLKTMLLQAFTSRFIAWSQYLCIAKFSSHLFRTRSGRIGQRRCFLFSKKNARSLIEVANCLGLLINNAFIAQCREGSHRKPSYVKKGKAPYCDTRSTRLSFILFLNLFRKLHNNSARFLHHQGSTRRGARLFSRSTRNNCRPDYIGIQKISQGLRGISRHKEIRFILFLRGLISNLSLATKFYSSPRRPPSIVF